MLEVYGYAFEPLSKDNFVVSNISDHIKQEYGDICDYFKLKECIDNIQPEIIFHLAAQPIVKKLTITH